MIRYIIICIFIGAFLILGSPLLGLTWLIHKKYPATADKMSLAIVNWAFKVIKWISGVKTTIIGEENVPKDVPVLYVGNHRGFYDIILTYPRVPRPTGYVAKKEMLNFPLFRSWMRRLHCIFLDRSNPKEGMKSILEAIDCVKSGISICIFPEGTRNKTDETLLPFHEGSFKIADKSGCPIVPMTIVNSSAVFEDHFPIVKKTHVVIEYGTPIILSELSKEDRKGMGAKVQKIIENTYTKNKEAYF